MMRPHEASTNPRSRIFNAMTWGFITVVLLLVAFPKHIAAYAIVVHLEGDEAAALVGRYFGRHKWPNSHKSVEGTIGYIILGLLLTLLWPINPLPYWHCAITVVVASIIEVLPIPPSNNFVTPVVLALILTSLVHAPF